MGHIKHHTIVVTSSIDELFEEAYNKGKEIFGNLCSQKVNGIMNGYNSFFIATDGSKEGWKDSNIYNSKRNEFVDWINSKAYEDGSNSISFVEVFFGEDNGYCEVVNHN